jgi:hypothetical protein
MPDVAAIDLVERIKRTRADLDAFLAAAVPRKRRLLNTVIFGGSFAALLTAGPAVGGQPFTAWLTGALGLTSPSWRLLCGAAALCSIMSTVATQLLKSHNIEDQISRAHACRAKLEVLELSLSLGEIDVKQAAGEYLRCVEQASFLSAGA